MNNNCRCWSTYWAYTNTWNWSKDSLISKRVIQISTLSNFFHSAAGKIGWLKTWNTHLPGLSWVKFQILSLVCVVQYLNDQKKSKNYPLNLNWLQEDQKHFQKWPLLLISAGISDLFLTILESSKSMQINWIFLLVILKQHKSNQ